MEVTTAKLGWCMGIERAYRLMIGPDHRRLLPASALLGSAFLSIVDTLCRSATAAEIPVGAVTALVGAPVFIGLLKRTHARGWHLH